MKRFMKIKPLIVIAFIIAIGILGISLFMSRDRSEEQVLESTYYLSKEYLLLRQQTDNILINAESYPDHASWDKDMSELIKAWNEYENKVKSLEEEAAQESESTALNFNLVDTANAYTAKEINDIYDKAPKFKGIATLAKHLGVDAKRAQLILNQVQDETSADIFIEEGDAFENLEHQAIVVKDGCKVVGFVGGVVLTGGTAGIATAGVLTKATIVVTGVDLALEVTEDGAQIALGDKNKISSFVGDVRTVTEPIANVMTITNIPASLGTGFGKFDSVMVGLESFRESAQEGKVVGVDLTNFEYQKPFQRIRQAKYPGAVSAAEMEKAEVEAWLASLNKKYVPMTEAEIKEFLASTEPVEAPQQEEQKKSADQNKNESNNQADGKNDGDSPENNFTGITWKGSLQSVSGGNNEEQSTEFEFVLNSDGTVSGNNFKNWKQEGDVVKLFGEDEALGHYEFKVNSSSLVLTKMVIGEEVIEPGQEYMGGFAPSGSLRKQANADQANSGESGSAMHISEYNELDESGELKDITNVEKYLGEPDVKTTDDKGRIVYVYFDIVKYDSGNLGSVKMAFYNEDDYKKYVTGMGGSWESNQENWDSSGGGIRATSQTVSGDSLKKQYGK